MTTEAERILTLDRQVNDAEASALAAEMELAAAEAELLQLREVVASQRQTIDAQNHAAVCAHEAYRRVVAERDALCARLMGGVWVWEIAGSAN